MKEDIMDSSVKTGLDIIGEMKRGALTLLRGHCGSGKTTTALAVSLNVAKDNLKVCYLGNEESKLEIKNKLISMSDFNVDVLDNITVLDYTDFKVVIDALVKRSSEIPKEVKNQDDRQLLMEKTVKLSIKLLCEIIFSNEADLYVIDTISCIGPFMDYPKLVDAFKEEAKKANVAVLVTQVLRRNLLEVKEMYAHPIDKQFHNILLSNSRALPNNRNFELSIVKSMVK